MECYWDIESGESPSIPNFIMLSISLKSLDFQGLPESGVFGLRHFRMDLYARKPCLIQIAAQPDPRIQMWHGRICPSLFLYLRDQAARKGAFCRWWAGYSAYIAPDNFAGYSVSNRPQSSRFKMKTMRQPSCPMEQTRLRACRHISHVVILLCLQNVRDIIRPFSGRYPYRILCLLSFCPLYTPFPQREKSLLQQHNYSR